jgi:hypothetical protein
MGWLVSVRILPSCQTVFCLFARLIFATGDFSTSARAQLQGFLTTGCYREGPKTLDKLWGCGGIAVPFMRKSGTVYA